MKGITLLFALACFTGSAFAGDISFYVLLKQQNFSQTSDAAPILQAGAPFEFGCFVDSTGPDLITDASVGLPGGGSRILQPDGSDSYAFAESFAAKSALDTTYGTGIYNLSVESENDFFSFAQLTMPSDNYPTTPRLTNYTAAQSITASNDFTLHWDAFAGGTADDFIRIEITSSGGSDVFETGEPGEPNALDGAKTSIVIPASTLGAGETYYVTLLYAKITTRNTTSIPGAEGVVAFVKSTTFTIQTAGTMSPIILESLGVLGGHYRFRFNTQPGRDYQVQRNDSLTGWHDHFFTNATSTEVLFSEPVQPHINRFFRVYRLP